LYCVVAGQAAREVPGGLPPSGASSFSTSGALPFLHSLLIRVRPLQVRPNMRLLEASVPKPGLPLYCPPYLSPVRVGASFFDPPLRSMADRRDARFARAWIQPMFARQHLNSFWQARGSDCFDLFFAEDGAPISLMSRYERTKISHHPGPSRRYLVDLKSVTPTANRSRMSIHARTFYVRGPSSRSPTSLRWRVRCNGVDGSA